ncbi:acetyl-coenzyme a transporter 1-like protein [Dermatophagoides farinae]|uniref:Acetyl-coenzyme a transporter 1-like protein n=1 Tax=Dermatophagoides farinae TaxID=6954 RepID=A0A9D4NTE0_DERFA|nr:acetyl-coenzyme a transporter 1-like protein [Dermatophagoides farinae]
MERKKHSSSNQRRQQKHHERIQNSFDNEESDEQSTSIRNVQQPNLQGDYLNIAILLFLYLLQGIPIGLISGVPLLLLNHGIGYSQQAIFSFAIWPFSCKLLWAPIVDSVYSSRFGRRKSWMIPAQYLIGAFMIIISYCLDSMINAIDGPNIYLLTAMFLILNFLAATQDIAVDGWALTMLKPWNVGYASTCNTVGQTSGYFLGYVTEGLVSLHGFFFFWGIVFIVATTMVMIFKREKPSVHENGEENMSIRQTYSRLIQIMKLGPVQNFAAVLLTCKIGFAITDAATGLKLKEAGLPMDHIALMAIPMLPLQMILPWIIGRYTNGPRPLDVFLRAYPFRLIFCFIFAGLLWWTRTLYDRYSYFPLYYYVVLIILYALHQITVYSMYVAIMAFHAKISDPSIGGTYMTLLNTITNLGGNWPTTLALWLIDYISLSYCSIDGSKCTLTTTKNDENDSCIANGGGGGGKCTLWLDGYYIETFIFTIIGIIWYFWGRKQINRLQTISTKQWLCPNTLSQQRHNS